MFVSIDTPDARLIKHRCLCRVDDLDVTLAPFGQLDRWSLEPDGCLKHLDTSILPRSTIDLIDRGGLTHTDDRILYYKTRPVAPTTDSIRTILAHMMRVNGWYKLRLHTLSELGFYWKPHMSSKAFLALVQRLNMTRTRHGKRGHDDDDDPNDRPTKRVRSSPLLGKQLGKRRYGHEDNDTETPLTKRARRTDMDLRAASHGTKRHRGDTDLDERPLKRGRLELIPTCMVY